MINLTENSLHVLRERYLRKDKNGKMETVEELAWVYGLFVAEGLCGHKCVI